jgi:hypothetical protein
MVFYILSHAFPLSSTHLLSSVFWASLKWSVVSNRRLIVEQILYWEADSHTASELHRVFYNGHESLLLDIALGHRRAVLEPIHYLFIT